MLDLKASQGRYLGVDFSGNWRKWGPGVRRSNVWIAELEFDSRQCFRLISLYSVQELPGTLHPFRALAGRLNNRDYVSAGIDAPFSVPAAHLGDGAWGELVAGVAALRHDGRPFPSGAQLVDLATAVRPKAEPKPLRSTEVHWKSEGVNVRSTLWNGPRGGAPFTAACLSLLSRCLGCVWPFMPEARSGMIVETFPAAQLARWGWPKTNYDGAKGTAVRCDLVARLGEVVGLVDEHRAQMNASADALDAVLCAIGAWSVPAGKFVRWSDAPVTEEGWIAVCNEVPRFSALSCKQI